MLECCNFENLLVMLTRASLSIHPQVLELIILRLNIFIMVMQLSGIELGFPIALDPVLLTSRLLKPSLFFLTSSVTDMYYWPLF